MVVPWRNSLTPHYIPLALLVGKPWPKGGFSEGIETSVSRAASHAAGAGRDSCPTEVVLLGQRQKAFPAGSPVEPAVRDAYGTSQVSGEPLGRTRWTGSRRTSAGTSSHRG